MDSQIYHWGIKKDASVDGEGRGHGRIPPDVSLDAPGSVSLGGGGPEHRSNTTDASSDTTSTTRIHQLLQKVKSTAEEMVERPEGLPENILKQFRPLLEKQLTAAKCKVLGDFLGFAPEFQKSVEIFLDKTLADAEDIVRRESLNLPPETWQHLQSTYQEKKASIQWLEDYLAKMEEPKEEPSQQKQDEALTEDAVGGILPTKQGRRRFPSEKLFSEHYGKHAKEFDGISESDYMGRAQELADSPLSDDVVALTRSDGSVAKYRFSTNEFMVINADGTIRTFFKPKDGKEYWDDELNRN